MAKATSNDADTAATFGRMRDVFIDCQTGHHSQASLIKAMTKIYGSVDAETFFVNFVNNVNYFLVVFKREAAVERTIDFLAKFCTSLQTAQSQAAEAAAEGEDKSTSLADVSTCQEDMHPFLLRFFKFLLENHKARDKAVRFRVCQLINKLFAALGDEAAIDDSLYEGVYQAMQIRLRDKFPIVRVHAVLALARLQDPSDPECPIIAAFKYMLEYDLNAEVRRAVMSSIAATTRTVGVMLERTRDSKDVMRRLAYQVIADKIHVRALTIAQRVRLLRQGLDDRVEAVREACVTQLVAAWLRTYNGNRLALLGLLDVENSLDVCQQLLGVLFQKSTALELTTDLEFLTDENVIIAEKLSSESAVYWRCLCEHLRSLGAESDEFVDKVLPSGVIYAKFLRSVADRLKMQQKLDEQLRNEFILQQLVHLVSSLDLTDEVARKHVVQVLRDLLLNDAVTHTVVRAVIARYSALHADGDAFVANVAEIISDIREPITVQTQDLSRDARRQIDVKLAAIRVQLNQLRDELDDCIQQQDFQRAAELKQKVGELEQTRQTLVSESAPQVTEVRTEKTDSQTLLKCLSIVSELLTESRFKKLTPSLQTLTETLILPGIQNADPAVRNQAIKSLGLCSLRSVDLARERLILLLQVSRMDQEVVQITALQAIFDLLHFFGLEAFKIDSAPADKSVAAQKGDGNTSGGSEDFDDLHSETSSDAPQAEKPDIGADIMTILTDLLDHNSSEVRTVCAEGFAKLLLAGRVVSPSLLSRLLLLWYNPVTEDDTRLRHCIGTFLPLYSFASRRNQELVADAIMPTLRALFDAPATSPLAEVKVANVADLLVELTDVNHPMAASRNSNGVDKDESPHDDIAIKIANEILSNPNSFDARVLVKVLCSLRISATNENVLKDLKVLCRRMLKEVKDKQCSRSLEKFTRSVRDKLQKLKQPSSADGASDAENNVFDTTAPVDDEDIDENEDPAQSDGDDDGKKTHNHTTKTGFKSTAVARPQRAKKLLMSYSRLSPDEDEDFSISEADTENDEKSTASPRTTRRATGAIVPDNAASTNVSKFSLDDDDLIDTDSDFELPTKPPQKSTAKGAAKVTTGKASSAPKATPLTSGKVANVPNRSSKRKRSPLSEQSN